MCKQGKFSAIRDCSASGGEVGILQLGLDSDTFIAASKEFAVIRAIGLNYLTNINNATPYGDMKHKWGRIKIKNFGKMIMLNALRAALNEMPQTYGPNDIKTLCNLS